MSSTENESDQVKRQLDQVVQKAVNKLKLMGAKNIKFTYEYNGTSTAPIKYHSARATKDEEPSTWYDARPIEESDAERIENELIKGGMSEKEAMQYTRSSGFFTSEVWFSNVLYVYDKAKLPPPTWFLTKYIHADEVDDVINYLNPEYNGECIEILKGKVGKKE